MAVSAGNRHYCIPARRWSNRNDTRKRQIWHLHRVSARKHPPGAAEIRIRAERRLGGMLVEQHRNGGLNKGGWKERKRKSCGYTVLPQETWTAGNGRLNLGGTQWKPPKDSRPTRAKSDSAPSAGWEKCWTSIGAQSGNERVQEILKNATDYGVLRWNSVTMFQ